MASRVDSSSEEEDVARGVQPYRFEPRRRVNDDEESDAHLRVHKCELPGSDRSACHFVHRSN